MPSARRDSGSWAAGSFLVVPVLILGELGFGSILRPDPSDFDTRLHSTRPGKLRG